MREVRVDCKNTGGVEQRMIVYSLSLIAGYSIAKWATPRSPQLLTRHLHIHHWIWSLPISIIMFWTGQLEIAAFFVGTCLQGLTYGDRFNIKVAHKAE